MAKGNTAWMSGRTGRGSAGVAAGGPGPSEVRMQIGTGDDVAALVLGAQLDAVQGHAVARALGSEVFGLAQPRLAHWLGLALRRFGCAGASASYPGIGNEPPMVRALGQGRW